MYMEYQQTTTKQRGECKMLKLSEFLEIEENVKFKIAGYDTEYKIIDGLLTVSNSNNIEMSLLDLNEVLKKGIVPVIEFSDDELTILKNIDTIYNFIARDEKSGNNCTLWAYTGYPNWTSNGYDCKNSYKASKLEYFEHIFKQINWETNTMIRIDDYVKRKGK